MKETKTLRVTFVSGRVEDVVGVGSTVLDRNSAILRVYGPEVYGQHDPIKNFVLANVESYEWVN